MSAISSLASALGISDVAEPVPCAIQEYDPAEGAVVEGTRRSFQYFPETINDTKNPEWSRRGVPGGSHPLLQFINGGERVITFTAVFSADKNPEEGGFFSSLLTGTFSLGLSDLFGGDKLPKHTVDVARAIAYLRSFTYPEYEKTGAAKPPPLAVIYLPNSGIVANDQIPDSIIGAMTQCDVVYEAFHRNGEPRLVAVNLSFVEAVQISQNWKFVGREGFKKFGLGYKRDVDFDTKKGNLVWASGDDISDVSALQRNQSPSPGEPDDRTAIA